MNSTAVIIGAMLISGSDLGIGYGSVRYDSYDISALVQAVCWPKLISVTIGTLYFSLRP